MTKKYEDDDILSIKEVLAYLQICRTTFYNIRKDKDKHFPRGFAISGKRDSKWLFKDVKEWLKKQKGIPAEA